MNNEVKEKISRSLKGHLVTDETKRKIGEGVRRYYEQNQVKDIERRNKLSQIMLIKNALFENYLEHYNINDWNSLN